ncbi:MAG: hypothetical protein AABZ60_19600, partial [Planctomycetota bacterium]
MSNSFRTIQDILESSRRGDSLYSIYQSLEQSEALLKEHQKNAFELLFESLIPSLSKGQFKELAKFPIDFLDIYSTTISVPITQTLSLFKGQKLYLNRVQRIDKATAKALAQWDGTHLELNGVKEIDEAVAKALAQWQGRFLSLNGVQQIDEATAKALA